MSVDRHFRITMRLAQFENAYHRHAHALEYLVGHLKPGASVLDVGCGSGVSLLC